MRKRPAGYRQRVDEKELMQEVPHDEEHEEEDVGEMPKLDAIQRYSNRLGHTLWALQRNKGQGQPKGPCFRILVDDMPLPGALNSAVETRIITTTTYFTSRRSFSPSPLNFGILMSRVSSRAVIVSYPKVCVFCCYEIQHT